MSSLGRALVMTCQPRDNIFECSTCNRASFVQYWSVVRGKIRELLSYVVLCGIM